MLLLHIYLLHLSLSHSAHTRGALCVSLPMEATAASSPMTDSGVGLGELQPLSELRILIFKRKY